MTRRKHIVDTMYRLASVKEQQATLAMSQAERERQAAADEANALEAAADAGEAELTGAPTLGSVERELLWAHRTWVRQERVATEERLAVTAQQVADAQARLFQRRKDTRVREKVRDHVVSHELSERELKTQKELDDIASTRWGRGHGQ